MHKVIGIDVSKKTLDISFANQSTWDHYQIPNNVSGFKRLIDTIGKDAHVVLEASGVYHLRLASYLHERGLKISVVNPLSIRRFAEWRLSRAKTDKKDAKLIAEFGMSQTLVLWNPEDPRIVKMKQKAMIINMLDRQIHQLNRQVESIEDGAIIDTETIKQLRRISEKLTREKCKTEKSLEQTCQSAFAKNLKLLKSIPGIGSKSAIMFITHTGNFKKFLHFKQFIAFAGMSPKIRQSGSSLNAKARICKMGNGVIRKTLFMCSLSAQQYNPVCKEMKHRLIKNGKPKMLINIAIANKLIKQAFAIIRSGEMFSKDFQQKACF